MAWFYNGRKYWYHKGKKYSRKIRKTKRIGYFWHDGTNWRQTSYTGYMDCNRKKYSRELYENESEYL